ncbi:hypothetical protein [Variovorax sp. YR266]|uniref:hypothetical protein n=1 Tax=Variovorax sp. YR266 TaxID=1884386 RepID=UPI00115F96B6|nr:hypothetical protein [Variovorax sp. YR266]
MRKEEREGVWLRDMEMQRPPARIALLIDVQCQGLGETEAGAIRTASVTALPDREASESYCSTTHPSESPLNLLREALK